MTTKPQIVQFGKTPAKPAEVQFGKHPASSEVVDAQSGIVPAYAHGSPVPETTDGDDGPDGATD